MAHRPARPTLSLTSGSRDIWAVSSRPLGGSETTIGIRTAMHECLSPRSSQDPVKDRNKGFRQSSAIGSVCRLKGGAAFAGRLSHRVQWVCGGAGGGMEAGVLCTCLFWGCVLNDMSQNACLTPVRQARRACFYDSRLVTCWSSAARPYGLHAGVSRFAFALDV